MKRSIFQTACFVFGVSIGVALNAQVLSQGASPTVANSEIRKAMSHLVQEDAKKAAAKQVTTDEGAAKPDEVVVLDRLEVVGERSPEFARPAESRVSQILRTGTIAEHVGKKTTIRLWTSGYAGVVLSLKW